jgi:ABC-type transport system involved in multi-copper enzyme maturation permease subunit
MWPIFTKTLYDSRKLIFWLFVGYGIYGMLISGIYPFMVENAENYNQMIESMPQEMFGLFGVDPETFDMASLGSYLHIEMMIWLLMIGGAVAIYQAFSAFTNAERDHSIEMLLSLPLSRRDNLLGQFAASVVTMFAALLGGVLGVIALTPTWKDIDFSVGEIALAVFGAMFPLLVIIALSFLLTAIFPSSKRFAGAIAYTFWIGSYMVFGLTSAIDILSDLKPLFVYNYYNAGDLVNDGINWGHWGLLLAVTTLLIGAAWWRVDDKQLGI